jgi:hypothetical protein
MARLMLCGVYLPCFANSGLSNRSADRFSLGPAVCVFFCFSRAQGGVARVFDVLRKEPLRYGIDSIAVPHEVVERNLWRTAA